MRSLPDIRMLGAVPLFLADATKSVEMTPNGIAIGLIRFRGWQLHRIDPLPAGFAGHAAYLVRVNYEFDVPADVPVPAWAETGFEFDAADVMVVDAIPRAVTEFAPASTYQLTEQLNFAVRHGGNRSCWAADASEANVALPAVQPHIDCLGLGGAQVRWRHSGTVPAGTQTGWLALLIPQHRNEISVVAGGRYQVVTDADLQLRPASRADAFTVRLPGSPEPDVPVGAAPGGACRVFVSYAQESLAHKQDVVRLCRLLAKEGGVDVRVDQDDLERRRNWDHWTTTQILRSDYVIVIASPVYRAVGDGELTDETQHRGVRSEYNRLADLLLRYSTEWSRKLLPVVLPGRSSDELPLTFLPGSSDHYVVTSFTPDGAGSLLRVLLAERTRA